MLFAFIGLKKYLYENTINDYSLIVDKEGGNENTSKAAQRVGLGNVTEENSVNSLGIRIADMLAGIISKLLKALNNALHYNSQDEGIKKKILNKSWFEIYERQLNLYKKMHSVIVALDKAWYKVYSGIYRDDLIVFIAFLGFMNHFEFTKDINASNMDMQGEFFNTYACKCLEDYFQRMGNKLPIDPIDKTPSEYFLNQRGAKVYFDIKKQPLLRITNGQRICNVLSVGFSKEMIPLVTVVETHEPRCYRLPVELSEWAMTLVGFANRGKNLLPSKVRFSKTKDGCYADILLTLKIAEEVHHMAYTLSQL